MIQVYGDFSGYTDIARGVSRLFGIEVMLNFRQPYFSANVTEFWQRWHISLNTWLKDYVYFPFINGLMNKTGLLMPSVYISVILTFLLSGLWHGAAMHFVVWGFLMGFLICIHTLMKQKKILYYKNPSKIWKYSFWVVSVLTTFTCLTLVEVFFRAKSCSVALLYLNKIFHGGTAGIGTVGLYVCFYGLCVIIIDALCAWQKSEVPFGEKIWLPVRSLGYAVMLFLLIFIGENDVQPFIYFQF
jgi:D-alanyl-lipoteichoic acid acyltransferase DltB (MBOAT superfamily)